MGNSKSSPSAERVLSQLRAEVAARIKPSCRIVAGLSGGMDSVVLLDLLHGLRDEYGYHLAALHVNHGISPHALDWSRFCGQLCAQLGVPLTTITLRVTAGPRESLEAKARTARYDALHNVFADVVALAHHRDDQAETFLLQALRGAGPRGLAAMPAWRAGRPALWRPLLALARDELRRYARARNLEWIEDESNADVAFKRNFVRHRVLPLMREAFPGAVATLARSARLACEANELLDLFAREDATRTGFADAPTTAALQALGPVRSRNLLRWFLGEAGLALPSSARLEQIYAQLAHPQPDSRVRLTHEGYEIGVYRGRITLHAPEPPPFAVAWRGESELTLPHGTLQWQPTTGEGLSASKLADGEVTIRSRVGGERLQLHPQRPHHTLKNLLQQAGVPPWKRQGLPLVWIDDRLAAVPGIGVASDFACPTDERGWRVDWHPANTLAGER